MYVVEVEYEINGMRVSHTLDIQADSFEDAIDMAHEKVKNSEPTAESINILSAEQVQGA